MNIKQVLTRIDEYKKELAKRGMDVSLMTRLAETYEEQKENLQKLQQLQEVKNRFNQEVTKLDGDVKLAAIKDMKAHSKELKEFESKQKEIDEKILALYNKVPHISSKLTPVGENDEDNVLIAEFGKKPEFSFDPKPYYHLPSVMAYISQNQGVKVMGSRGYYLRGQVALFEKALFDIASEIILKHNLELMSVPLMLNEETLIGTGHLPDFDGQMYEVNIDENKSFYLISSSEPSLMSYYKDELLEEFKKPIHVTADTVCFRKEAGSYGRDQQGILRVHQFRKMEMIAICRQEDNDRLFDLHGAINREIFDTFGLHYREVEVCSGDMPHKHYRQVDFEGWFPGENKFRELSSNGSAGSFQTSRLNINYLDQDGNKVYPWSLNCTGLTFRTGLAILEQNQRVDGSVVLPEVIAKRVGFDTISL